VADYTALGDEQLADLLRSGDPAAFTEIYNRHWKFLYNSAYNILRHHQDTLDVCQSILLWFWEHHEKITIQTSIRAYLFTSVKYKIANLIRQGKVRETLFTDADLENIRADEFVELEVKELKNLIGQLVNDLPPKCREIFKLSREENLTHKQIAGQLGISERTVDEQISRALKKLRVPLSKLASLLC
jgi:RNA polymerase sigma-70 factor (family 1)